MKTYGYIEIKRAMHEAADYFIQQIQVFGISNAAGEHERFGVNPYVERKEDWNDTGAFRYVYSPVGAVMGYLDVNIAAIERISNDHIAYCHDEACEVCDMDCGNADTSIYSPWVQKWLRDVHEIEFTEEARDLLWEAETSGLPLYEFMDLLDERANA